MRLRVICAAMLAVAAGIGVLGVTAARAVETTTVKPVVEVPEDKALVYFFSPKRPGSRLLTFVYVDDEFVGVLRHNSFTYAVVEEGRHVLWTFSILAVKSGFLKAMAKLTTGGPWEGSEFRAARGRTYHFGFVPPDGDRSTHTRFGEAEGAERIGRIKFYATPSDEDVEASAAHLAQRGSEVVERFQAAYVEAPDHPAPRAPDDVTGLMRVDAGTEVALELAQNLWSERDSNGDEVWFRVAEDAVGAEGVWLRRGSLVRGLLRHAHEGESNVRGAALDVAISALVAVDGTVVPAAGEIYHQGGGFSKESAGARGVVRIWDIVEGGDDNLGPAGGMWASLLLGTRVTARTRDPVWIAPASGAGVPEEAPRPARLLLRLEAQVVRFPPSLRRTLRFSVGHRQPPATVRVRSIAGRPPPVEIEAMRTTLSEEGWVYVFDLWQVVKFVPLTGETGRTMVKLDGVLEDGTTLVVEAPIEVKAQQLLRSSGDP